MDTCMNNLAELQNRVLACTLCPRLVDHREKVALDKRRMYRDWEYWGKPLPAFGDPHSRILVLGLAPAAHGGNRTGRMFTGDRSGDWVMSTLHKFGFASSPISNHRDDGLTLNDAYITAALRCAPPANKPLREERANCLTYLLAELDLLTQVQVVVALGRLAFDTYLSTCTARQVDLPSPKPKFGHLATYTLGGGIHLIGSYHPSQQNTQTGRLTREMFEQVFQRARDLLG